MARKRLRSAGFRRFRPLYDTFLGRVRPRPDAARLLPRTAAGKGQAVRRTADRLADPPRRVDRAGAVVGVVGTPGVGCRLGRLSALERPWDGHVSPLPEEGIFRACVQGGGAENVSSPSRAGIQRRAGSTASSTAASVPGPAGPSQAAPGTSGWTWAYSSQRSGNVTPSTSDRGGYGAQPGRTRSRTGAARGAGGEQPGLDRRVGPLDRQRPAEPGLVGPPHMAVDRARRRPLGHGLVGQPLPTAVPRGRPRSPGRLLVVRAERLQRRLPVPRPSP